ncbi:hypothetical protein ACQY0O_003822 [Thecaphora frezii]
MHSTARSARSVCRASAPWSSPTSPSTAPITTPLEPKLATTHRRLATAATFPLAAQPYAAFRLDHSPARSAWALLSSPYSTKHPAGPVPGSNNDLHPRGVDYSLFEEEQPTRVESKHRTRPKSRSKTNGIQRRSGSSNIRLSSSDLSPAAALLRRLIRQKEFRSASQVLEELETLEVRLDEPIPEYVDAAFHALRNRRKHEALQWLALSPSLHFPAKPDAPLKPYLRKANEKLLEKFRKVFTLLLDTAGDDLQLLQKASLLAAKKGYWAVLQTTLAQILRFGLSIPSTSAGGSPSKQGWAYFQGLMQMAELSADHPDAPHSLRARTGLKVLYRLSVRTLALSARLNDAIYWVRTPLESMDPSVPGRDLLELDAFSYSVLMEELLKRGSAFADAATALEALIRSHATPPRDLQLPSIAMLSDRIRAEGKLRAEVRRQAHESSDPSEADIDGRLSQLIANGDLVEARNVLLLSAKPRPRRAELGDGEDAAPDVRSTVALPSAGVLADFQHAVVSMGAVPVVSSPMEEVLVAQSPLDPRTFNAQFIPKSKLILAPAFLRPVQKAIQASVGGRGLWETAQLLGHVERGAWKEALQFYAGPNGFRVPAGGITDELIALACGGEGVAPVKGEGASTSHGQQWPSTHAINLALRALVGTCVEARDYGRLERVYRTWKANSLPSVVAPSSDVHPSADASPLPTADIPSTPTTGASSASTTDASAKVAPKMKPTVFADLLTVSEHVGELHFEHWPPGHLPDSYSFDAFLRGFARLDVEVSLATSDVALDLGIRRKQQWGSSQRALSVIRDMTAQFQTQASVASWTIVLEALARQGVEQWYNTTEKLANGMGIRTRSAPAGEAQEQEGGADEETLKGLPKATLETYTALMHAMLHVPVKRGELSPLLDQAIEVHNDLLSRTKSVPEEEEEVRRKRSQAWWEEDEDEIGFLDYLLDAVRSSNEARPKGQVAEGQVEEKKPWTLLDLWRNEQTIEVLREVYLLQKLKAETEVETEAPQTGSNV